MSREFLMIVQESAYKTPVATPVPWTTASTWNTATAYYLRLDKGNGFTVRPAPVEVGTPYGGGVAVRAYTVSDKQVCKGELSVQLCGSNAAFLLAWAGTRINAGQTLPWVTTQPVGDLASCSVYHAIQRSDGTYKRRVYLGTKVESWDLSVSEGSTVVTLKLGLVASTPQGNQFDGSADPTAVTFPAPADDNLPVDPYLWIHTGSDISIGGTVRTAITELHLASKNKLASRFFNNRYLQLCQWMGRETTCAVKLQYAPTPDDRTAYEGLTSNAVSVEFNTGTRTMSFTMNAQNVFSMFADDLPLDDLYFQSSTLMNQWDATAGSDFTLAFT